MPVVSVLVSLALVLLAFLGLVLVGALSFEPISPAHIGLAAAIAPLAAAIRWLLRRLGW
jgi:hypothetical protein